MEIRNNPNAVKQILKLYYNEDWTTQKIGDSLGVSKNTIIGILRDVRDGKLEVQDNTDQEVIRVYGDAVVIADLHVPLVDYSFLARVIPVGQYYGIRTLHIAGDLNNQDTYSTFRKLSPAAPLTAEIKEDREILSGLSTWYNRIIFSMGNHDARFLLSNDGKIDHTFFYYLLKDSVHGDFEVSPFDRVEYRSGGQNWAAIHPNDFRSKKLILANDLAQALQMNVIVAHQHFSAIGFDTFGRYVTIDIGGLHNPTAFEYKTLHTSARPAFNQGFAVIKDGQGILLTPDKRLTNWDFLDS